MAKDSRPVEVALTTRCTCLSRPLQSPYRASGVPRGCQPSSTLRPGWGRLSATLLRIRTESMGTCGRPAWLPFGHNIQDLFDCPSLCQYPTYEFVARDRRDACEGSSGVADGVELVQTAGAGASLRTLVELPRVGWPPCPQRSLLD